MALKSTIFGADVQISDMDRNYYANHALTLAQHPSETDERMMVRLLAFALHAHEHLAFGNGLSTDDEPDLWLKDLTGAIDTWIDVGMPDEKFVRRACGRAKQVFIYAYGGRVVDMWWQGVAAKLAKCDNLSVYDLSTQTTKALAQLAGRNMKLQCTIQDGEVWLGSDKETVKVEWVSVKSLVANN
ncbi:MAG: YaeQ family protein [Burkholderiales bacterium]